MSFAFSLGDGVYGIGIGLSIIFRHTPLMFGFGKNASRKKALAELQSMADGDWLCAGCG